MNAQGSKDEQENIHKFAELQEDIITHTVNDRQTIVLGDFNSHIHKENEVRRTNKNGKMVQALLKETNNTILNNNEKIRGKWTWMRKDQKSEIDLIICPTKITERLMKGVIDDEGEIVQTNHDHSWMEIEIKTPQEESKQVVNTKKWNITKDTDWEEFQKELNERLKNVNEEDITNPDSPSIDLIYDKIIETLVETGEQTIGKRNGNTFFTNKLPRKVRKWKKRKSNAVKQWKLANKNDNKSTAKKKWKEMKKVVKKAKNVTKKADMKRIRNWIKKNKNDSKAIWNKIRGPQEEKTIEMMTMNNEITTNPNEIRRYIQKYWEDKNEGLEEETQIHYHPPNQKLDEIMLETISKDEYYKNKMKLHNWKSCGWDDIPNEFLKYGGEKLDGIFRLLFQTITKDEYIPKGWKEDKVTMIFKKGDKNKCENYRAIAISSNVYKLFSRIYHERIAKYIEDNNIISEAQNAFRKDRSTYDNLFILQAIWDKTKTEHDNLCIAYIDIEKAYDEVSLKKLWDIMEEKKLGGKLLRMLKEVYRDQKRKIRTIGGWTDWVKTKKGLRQGSVFSPILFALYIDDIIRDINEMSLGIQIGDQNIVTLAFADDIIITTHTQEQMDLIIQKIEQKLTIVKQKINYDKSIIQKIRSIGRRTKKTKNMMQHEPQTRRLKEDEQVKYLGIQIDKRQALERRKKHILDVKNRLIGLLKWKTKVIEDRLWAVDEMWKQQTRATFLYGMEVIPTNTSFEQELEKAQTKIARWALRLWPPQEVKWAGDRSNKKYEGKN